MVRLGMWRVQILREQLVQNADIDDNAGGDTVAAFSDIACLVPRLKVDIDLSLSMVHLQVTGELGPTRTLTLYQTHTQTFLAGCWLGSVSEWFVGSVEHQRFSCSRRSQELRSRGLNLFQDNFSSLHEHC